MPIESCPSELKVSISKFIGNIAHTFLGSCVYPRLGFNLPMLCKSLRASKYEYLRGEDVSRKWSNLSVYCFGSSGIGSQVEFLDQLKIQVSPVQPVIDHGSIRCLSDAPKPRVRFNR